MDWFDNMREFATTPGFTFPYVIEETHEVARTYGAYSVRPTSSAPMLIRIAVIAGVSMPRARRRSRMPAVTYSRR